MSAAASPRAEALGLYLGLHLSLGLALTVGSSACEREGGQAQTEPPKHDALVNAHLGGDYQQVLRWCPVVIGDPEAELAVADWCMYALPAALRLSMDVDAALDFVRTVCTDIPSGVVKGGQDFREYYVREVSRWVGLPLRAQKQELALETALPTTVDEFSAACQVDPSIVNQGLDTQLGRAGRR